MVLHFVFTWIAACVFQEIAAELSAVLGEIKAQDALDGNEQRWSLTQRLPWRVAIWNPVLIVRGFTVSPPQLPLARLRLTGRSEVSDGEQ